MKSSRTILGSFVFAVASAASAQVLPPPAYAGQSYWFGPGPSTYSVGLTTQDSGGYAEHSFSLATGWSLGAFGGPAYVSSNDTGSSASTLFNVSTSLQVLPYIYIDGYFGLSSSMSGFLGGTVPLGSSKFYVLHNAPVSLQFVNLLDLSATVGSTPVEISTTYNIFLRDYANPSNYTSNFQVEGSTSNISTSSVDNVLDEGILEVEIARIANAQHNIPAATYNAGGTVEVTAL